MFKLYCILIIVHYISAAVSIETCPNVKAVDNFQMSEYNVGVWYEIARYPNEIEKRGDCVTLLYSHDNGRYTVNLTEIIDGQLNFISGNQNVSPDDKNSGIVYLHSSNITGSEVGNAFPVHILAIDYSSYVVCYECRYDEVTQTRTDYVWILSRSKTLDESAKKEVDDFLESIDYIDRNKLVWDSFSEESCKITS